MTPPSVLVSPAATAASNVRIVDTGEHRIDLSATLLIEGPKGTFVGSRDGNTFDIIGKLANARKGKMSYNSLDTEDDFSEPLRAATVPLADPRLAIHLRELQKEGGKGDLKVCGAWNVFLFNGPAGVHVIIMFVTDRCWTFHVRPIATVKSLPVGSRLFWLN
jgi:hypothetical protein